jgi:hypothetical protein
MGNFSATSSELGTALVQAAGTLTGVSVVMPPSQADRVTPITFCDATSANYDPYSSRTLFSAPLSALDFIYGTKPNIPGIPGAPAASPPGTIGGPNMNIPFSQGLYFKSCPAGVTINVTTA